MSLNAQNSGGMTSSKTKSSAEYIMSPVTVVVRIVFGLVFLVYGVNGPLQFLPMPPISPKAMPLIQGIMASGYIFPLMAITMTIAGAALVIGRYVPLALALLAPLIVNIFAIHLFLSPSGLPHALAFVVAEAFLVWAYREAFRPMLGARSKPAFGKQAGNRPSDT